MGKTKRTDVKGQLKGVAFAKKAVSSESEAEAEPESEDDDEIDDDDDDDEVDVPKSAGIKIFPKGSAAVADDQDEDDEEEGQVEIEAPSKEKKRKKSQVEAEDEEEVTIERTKKDKKIKKSEVADEEEVELTKKEKKAKKNKARDEEEEAKEVKVKKRKADAEPEAEEAATGDKKKKREDTKEDEDKAKEPVDDEADPAKKDLTLYVSGIPWSVDEKTLYKDFSACGKVKQMTMPMNDKGKPRGIAFITFTSQVAIKEALKLDGKQYEVDTEGKPTGRYLSVTLADKAKQDKGKSKGLTKDRGPRGFEVFILGLPFETERAVLRKDFEECGEITSLNMLVKPDGSCRGVAFITYKDMAGVEKACKYNGTEYGGREIKVEFSTQGSKGSSKGKSGEGKEASKGKTDSGKGKGSKGKDSKGKDSKGKGKGKGEKSSGKDTEKAEAASKKTTFDSDEE